MIGSRTIFLAIALAAGGTLAAPALAKDDAAGAAAFRQRCGACHSVTKPTRNGVGPSLAGVVSRKAGSTTFAYSPAMKRAGVTWTRANLDRFLTGPAKMVPGTRMSVSVADAAMRKTIIDYLAGQK